MNKSTYSQDVVDTYSKLLDMPVPISKKNNFKKRMFSAPRKEEEEEDKK